MKRLFLIAGVVGAIVLGCMPNVYAGHHGYTIFGSNLSAIDSNDESY